MKYLEVAAGAKGASTWAHVIEWERQAIAIAVNSDRSIIHLLWGKQFDGVEQFPLLATSSAWREVEWESRRLKDDIVKLLREYARYSYFEASVRRDRLETFMKQSPGEIILRFTQDYLVVGTAQTKVMTWLDAKTVPTNREVMVVTDSRYVLNALTDEEFLSLFATPQKPIMMIGTWGKQMAILTVRTQPKQSSVITQWLEAVN